MDATIANWGIELTFIRTTVGKDALVVDALTSSRSDIKCTYLSAFGYFDLVGIRPIQSLNDAYSVLLHAHISESAPFRFFADEHASQESFQHALSTWRAAIAITAKIHPTVVHKKGGAARWEVAAHIRKILPETFVFFGLGFSELLIFAGGNDAAKLFTVVRELRACSAAPEVESQIFAKTTTFPFLSYELIYKPRDFASVVGLVEPVVTLSCAPGAERNIADAVKSQGISCKNIFGKNDLLLAWKQPISFGELAGFLVDFRSCWGANGTVGRTTTYLETAVRDGPVSIFPYPEITSDFLDDAEEQILFEQLQQAKPHSLRAAVSDLALRLCACLRNPLLHEYFKDMVNTFEFVADLLRKLNGSGKSEAREAGAQASRVADAARAAINQRYAGLELHPETLAHSHSPLLCDIRSIVAAATCLPHYIFDKLFDGTRASQTWSGFVLFGGAYSPQWFDQDVLALPPVSLLTPVEEWWKVTHEAAHAVFRLAKVETAIPMRLREHILSGDNNDLGVYQIISEQFANWFDWKYVFRRDTPLYLHLIWKGWINFELVWQSKPQYFARSFGVLLAEDTARLGEMMLQHKHDVVFPFLNKELLRFFDIIKRVPQMESFITALTPEEKLDILELTYSLFPLIRWFEKDFEQACDVSGLLTRLTPAYDEVSKHVEKLKRGEIVFDTIVDPPRLHVELLRSLKDTRPSLATEIAYIYSLENTYLTTRD